jgi:hypothetical protein
MKEFKSKSLIGLEDFSDDKYSIYRLSQAEKGQTSFEKKAGWHGIKKEKKLEISKRGGKTQGDINAKNGHCKSIAKLGGDANVKSGHIDKIRHLAIEACSIPLLQFDKNENFIKEWKSAVEAAKSVGTTPQNISLVLNPKTKNKTAGGFIWKYKNN